MHAMSFGEVGALSLDLLSILASNDVTRDIAAGALVLSALRVMLENDIGEEAEAQIVGEALDWLMLRITEPKGMVH